MNLGVMTMDDVDQETKRVAMLIAMFHGAKMTYRHDGQMHTVASEHGFGHFGDASERYMHAYWQQYVGAASAVIEDFKKGWTGDGSPAGLENP